MVMPHPRYTTGRHRTLQRGFSVIEVLVVAALLGMLAAIALSGFGNLARHAALESATHNLYTALSEARSATLASEFGEQFGVRIEEDRFIRFRGAAYNPAAATNDIVFFSGVTVTTTLAGGPTIMFAKQTGTTTNSGTITLTHQSTLASTTLTLYSSGVVSAP